jgi:hypothetical protein
MCGARVETALYIGLIMSDPASETRERARRWLHCWKHAGAALEAERLRRLRGLGIDEARQLTRHLLSVWRPADVDELGAELLTQQRWFTAAARSLRPR